MSRAHERLLRLEKRNYKWFIGLVDNIWEYTSLNYSYYY